MRIRSPSTARFALLAAASCLLLSGNASALDEAGTIKTLKGTASIEREGKKLAAEPGGKVMVNDRILTAADSTIGITLRDNTLLSAGANSTLVVNRFAFNSTTHAGAVDATLKRGTLAVVSPWRWRLQGISAARSAPLKMPAAFARHASRRRAPSG